MAERNWVLNDSAPVSVGQEFGAASPKTWGLHDSVVLDQQFETPPAAWAASYWGPWGLAFNEPLSGVFVGLAGTSVSIAATSVTADLAYALTTNVTTVAQESFVPAVTWVLAGVSSAVQIQELTPGVGFVPAGVAGEFQLAAFMPGVSRELAGVAVEVQTEALVVGVIYAPTGLGLEVHQSAFGVQLGSDIEVSLIGVFAAVQQQELSSLLAYTPIGQYAQIQYGAAATSLSSLLAGAEIFTGRGVLSSAAGLSVSYELASYLLQISGAVFSFRHFERRTRDSLFVQTHSDDLIA